jgi:hypothetical protein
MASEPSFHDDGDSEISAMEFHPKLFQRVLLISVLTGMPKV